MRPEHPQARRIEDLVTRFALTVRGAAVPADLVTSGVVVSSGDTLPGDVFVAVPGLKVHGAVFAGQALDAGAVAVLTDEAGLELLTSAGLDGRTPVLLADDPRALAGPVAAWLHGDPGTRLVTVGITGTNGKTTTTYFVDAALRAVHERTAVLGTVELRIGEEAIESPRTTVEAPVLQGILALALERGATAVSTEVSSHALALGRVHGLQFDVVAFTNLQRDHLDFHGDMEGYFRDKSRLFAPAQARRGVVVIDDEWGRRLASEAQIPVESVATHVGRRRARPPTGRSSARTSGWTASARRSCCAAPTASSTGPRAPCRARSTSPTRLWPSWSRTRPVRTSTSRSTPSRTRTRSPVAWSA
ncbi:Mur ligase family protein [Cellulomonas soli]